MWLRYARKIISLLSDLVISRPERVALRFFRRSNPTIHDSWSSIANIERDRNNNRLWVPSKAPSQIPSADMYGQMSMPQSYDMNIGTERIDPSILNAFRQNPYTKSLNVY
jgi:hypothetical protein